MHDEMHHRWASSPFIRLISVIAEHVVVRLRCMAGCAYLYEK